jgi:two-component system, LytTR family, sensor kinase
MQGNKKWVQTIIYLAIWTGFLAFPFVSFSGSRETPFVPERRIQVLFFLTNLFLIGFYYLHSLVLIPRLLATRKVTFYVSIIILLMAFFAVLPVVYFHFVKFPSPRFIQNMRPMPTPGEHRPFSFRRIFLFPFTGSLVMFLLILVISGGIKIINEWFRTERRNQEIEREKATTELTLLKSQVNPHFLFNTLNNIYSLAVTNNPETAGSVMKLSSIMRYVLDEAKSNYVPLSKEILFIENYIALQSVRLTDKSTIKFINEPVSSDKQIAPLLLIAFVENAFKYGVSTHIPSEIDIELHEKGNQLNFRVKNQIMNVQGNMTNTGIGLTNTKRRLELLYPGKHSLQIKNEGGTFEVILMIDLI